MKIVPRYHGSLLHILKQQDKFIDFQNDLVNQFGDICHFKLFHLDVYLISKPAYIKHILFTKRSNYPKYKRFKVFQKFMGRYGLIFTNDQEQWKKDKTIMLPAFQESHFAHYCDIVAQNCESMLREWDALEVTNKSVDMDYAMAGLSLKNLTQAFLGNIDVDLVWFSQALRYLMTETELMIESVTQLPWILPTPRHFKFKRARRDMQNYMDAMIKNKRPSGDNNDLMDKLLIAYENDPDKLAHIRDQLFTLLAAGHETTAAALSWVWVLLSKFPAAARKIQEEVAANVGQRIPTYQDLSNLRYTQHVLFETMRLCPPVPSLLRSVNEPDEIDGYRIPQNAIVIIPISAVHRRSDLWPNPEGFDPQRFEKIDLNSENYLYGYIPFGGGPRICLGKNFAIAEACLIMAMVLQKFNLYLPSHCSIKAGPGFVLRPADLNMHLQRRTE